MVKQPMVIRNIRVPKQLWDDAKAAAEDEDKTISDVVRDELEQYVERKKR